MIRYLTELSLEAFVEAARNVPYQQINSDLFPGIDLWIRRDDLIDPLISGNKAYKLIYNLLEARDRGLDTIITCGGAWSNHIHATAAAGLRFGFKTVGIIRGHRPPVLSAMLQDAERFGMELRFVSRLDYKKRNDAGFLAGIGLGDVAGWFVPESGANFQGARGIQLLGKAIEQTKPIDFEECWVACGTGLTLGALASGMKEPTKLVGVPVLKAEPAIREEANQWASTNNQNDRFSLIKGAHHGGYGKSSSILEVFQCALESQESLVLEHVYTAKIAYALAEQSRMTTSGKGLGAKKGVLLLHTGGLQGARGVVK
ncbi:pyridoxal-phosphate dependent enzyme [Microbulbifer sp.]|uniref:1-aminocyclopropane-1-carboxylate deaminase/D-cysteine desulfhydrase n=1 Tax=Microbulbifer sp. TaxID=1908541 RepID=UPI00258AD34C|nr:pyridoxal-phosphate dependent enzyme [Microbulbifer sp.]